MSLSTMLNLDSVLILQAALFLFLGFRLWGLAVLHSSRVIRWLSAYAIGTTGLCTIRLLNLEGLATTSTAELEFLLATASTILLVEFARRQQPITRSPGWLLLPVGFGLVGLTTLQHADPAPLSLGLGIVGAIAACSARWAARTPLEQSNPTKLSRRTGLLLSINHLVYTFPAAWDFSWLPGSGDGLLHWARAAIVTCFMLSALLDCQEIEHPHESADLAKSRRQRRLICVATIAVIAGIGWLATNYVGDQQDASMRHQILTRTQIATAGLDAADVASLQWDERDLTNPRYQKLKQQMIAMREANTDLKFVLLAGYREGRAHFLVDSEPPESEDYSPPGQHYEEATEEYLAGLQSNQPFVLGPETDRWGTWMFGDVPIRDESGNTIAYLELDVAATDWNFRILHARLPVQLITLLIIALVLGSYHALERLREHSARIALSEQRNRSLVEGSPDCVQMFDLTGRCVAVNRNGLSALGLTEAEVINRPFSEIWPLESREKINGITSVACAGRAASLETDYLRPDGKRLTWRVATNPITDETGQVCSFVAISVDISARKQMELALRAAKKTAEEATQAKSDFLAVMSHEIRTPLSGITGMLELLQQTALDPLARRYTRFARDSADSLMHLLNDALDSAKIEAGKLSLEVTPFRPHHFFEAVFESASLRANSKQITFRHAVDASVPAVLLGDPARLRQVINNLVNNALKFTSQGGVTCTLSAEPVTIGSVLLKIAVTDTGIGISEEARGRLFAKYAQADASTTRQYGGTGLGLSIVKSLAELMGGDVSVASTPGEGSTFTFTGGFKIGTEAACPIAPEPVPPAPVVAPVAGSTPKPTPTHPPKTTAAPAPTRSLRVLIVDDDIANRTVAESLVTNLGHQAAAFAVNGREAVDHLIRESFDVVLMDNRMPVMDGFTATKLIRDPATKASDPTVYIVALTANASPDDRARCLSTGMNDFITKPVRAPAMTAALNRAIEHLAQRRPSTPAPAAPPPLANGVPGLSADDLLASLDAPAAPAAECEIDPAILEKITAIFLRETPRRFATMKTALATSDAELYGREAHTLKSNARYVSAPELSALAAEMEKLADQKNLPAAAAYLPKAEALYTILEARLSQPAQT